MLENEPTTREEAIASDHRVQWEKAMEDEYASLLQNNTWTLTDLPQGRKAIVSK